MMQEKIKIDPYLLTAIVCYLGRLPTSVQDLYSINAFSTARAVPRLEDILKRRGYRIS